MKGSSAVSPTRVLNKSNIFCYHSKHKLPSDWNSPTFNKLSYDLVFGEAHFEEIEFLETVLNWPEWKGLVSLNIVCIHRPLASYCFKKYVEWLIRTCCGQSLATWKCRNVLASAENDDQSQWVFYLSSWNFQGVLRYFLWQFSAHNPFCEVGHVDFLVQKRSISWSIYFDVFGNCSSNHCSLSFLSALPCMVNLRERSLFTHFACWLDPLCLFTPLRRKPSVVRYKRIISTQRNLVTR